MKIEIEIEDLLRLLRNQWLYKQPEAPLEASLYNSLAARLPLDVPNRHQFIHSTINAFLSNPTIH